MAITIALPGALRPYAGGSLEVMVDERCDTVEDVLGALAVHHAGVVDRVVDETGELRRHVNVFVDGDNVRWLEGLQTAVEADSTIVIVPAVSGG
ncbi:MAG TPA: ubiquitin-like small modifier protein 1 [Longimicrobium sp.]|nr:ubiquitin-like small modifier protein 1 [Longimicrobium sp.]